MMKHGINKCRVCDHYINSEDTCEFCDFKWSTEYSPWTDDWDIINIDDDVEWSFLQIMYRLKAFNVDCLQVFNWFEGDAILITGIREMYPDRIAKALGVHKECISLDADIGICVVNLFMEKALRTFFKDVNGEDITVAELLERCNDG